MLPENNKKYEWIENISNDGWVEFSDAESYRKGWDSPSF
jgi:hypothetical protein